MKKKDIYENFFQSFKTVVFQSIVVKKEIQYQCFNQVIQKNKNKKWRNNKFYGPKLNRNNAPLTSC